MPVSTRLIAARYSQPIPKARSPRWQYRSSSSAGAGSHDPPGRQRVGEVVVHGPDSRRDATLASTTLRSDRGAPTRPSRPRRVGAELG